MDIKLLDLNLLRSLDALLTECSVTGAAQQIGISQPAMSAQLARLRKLLGDPLLVASGRRMVATDRAEALRAPLKKLMQDLEGLLREQAPFEPGEASDTFRLGGTDYVHAVVSAGLIHHLLEQAPGIRLAMMPFQSEQVWQDLESGRMDAAVVTTFVTLNEAKARHLLEERFVLVQRRGHPRGSKPPTLDAFCDLDHVLVSPEGGGFTGAVDKALRKVGRMRRIVASLPSFLLVPPLVQTSDLVCVFPERLARVCADDLELCPLPFELTGFDLQMIWHPRRHNDPAHVWFRNAVAEHVRQQPAIPRR